MARLRRVEPGILRQVFERLNRSGELDILVAHLEDEADGVHEAIQSILAGEVIHEPRQLAECQARQGALGALRSLAVAYKQLGSRMASADAVRNARNNGEPASAPSRVRV